MKYNHEKKTNNVRWRDIHDYICQRSNNPTGVLFTFHVRVSIMHGKKGNLVNETLRNIVQSH